MFKCIFLWILSIIKITLLQQWTVTARIYIYIWKEQTCNQRFLNRNQLESSHLLRAHSCPAQANKSQSLSEKVKILANHVVAVLFVKSNCGLSKIVDNSTLAFSWLKVTILSNSTELIKHSDWMRGDADYASTEYCVEVLKLCSCVEFYFLFFAVCHHIWLVHINTHNTLKVKFRFSSQFIFPQNISKMAAKQQEFLLERSTKLATGKKITSQNLFLIK